MCVNCDPNPDYPEMSSQDGVERETVKLAVEMIIRYMGNVSDNDPLTLQSQQLIDTAVNVIDGLCNKQPVRGV